jgi:hypothetical protein
MRGSAAEEIRRKSRRERARVGLHATVAGEGRAICRESRPRRGGNQELKTKERYEKDVQTTAAHVCP